MNNSDNISHNDMVSFLDYYQSFFDSNSSEFNLSDWFRRLPGNHFNTINYMVLDESKTGVYHIELDGFFQACVRETYNTKESIFYIKPNIEKTLRFIFIDIFRCIYMEKNGMLILKQYEFDLNKQVHVVDDEIGQKLVSTTTYQFTAKGKSYISNNGLDNSSLKEIYLSIFAKV